MNLCKLVTNNVIVMKSGWKKLFLLTNTTNSLIIATKGSEQTKDGLKSHFQIRYNINTIFVKYCDIDINVKYR